MLAFTKTFAILTGLVATAIAVPTEMSKRGAAATPTIQLCENFNLIDCFTVPVVAIQCLDLVGGLSFLNEEVSSVLIPNGFICTFFENFSCISEGAPVVDSIALQGGFWNFNNVPADEGSIDFDNQASSLICSPII